MKKSDQAWPQEALPVMTAEQTILWLDGYRQLMWEVWKNNPELYKEWQRLNQCEPQLPSKKI